MIFFKFLLLLFSTIIIVNSKDLFDSDIYDKLKEEMDNTDIYGQLREDMENWNSNIKTNSKINKATKISTKKSPTKKFTTTLSVNKTTKRVLTYSNNFTVPDRNYVVGTKTYKPKKVSTVKIPTLPTIISNDKCGSQSDGVYICKSNKCCGKNGRCGSGSSYCSKGCKPNYGNCW